MSSDDLGVLSHPLRPCPKPAVASEIPTTNVSSAANGEVKAREEKGTEDEEEKEEEQMEKGGKKTHKKVGDCRFDAEERAGGG